MNFRQEYEKLIEQLNNSDATEDTESREKSSRKYDREELSLHLSYRRNGLDLVVTPKGKMPLEQVFLQLHMRIGQIRADDVAASWSIGGKAPDHIRHAMHVITAEDSKRARTTPLTEPEAMLRKMQRVIDAFLGKPPLEYAKL